MQFYKWDNVKVKEGVVDHLTGKRYSGDSGTISDIGYRDDLWPITVEIYNKNTDSYEDHYF